MRRYAYWGLQVAANEAWPALSPFQENGPAGPAEIEIVVQRRLLGSPLAEVSVTPGRVEFQVAGVGRYTISGGCRIEVVPEPGAKTETLELFLLGSAWGALCYQRGVLPLHAGVVQSRGRTAAFCGPSGSGKSTLLAWLVDRGGRLLSDDLCRCDPEAQPAALVWPSLPRLKLWRETLAALDRPSEGLVQDLPSEDKFHWPMPPTAPLGPQPLHAIYLLEWGPLKLERLAGAQALRQFVNAAAYRAGLLDRMGLLADYWQVCAGLLRRVPLFRLSRPRQWSSLDEAADLTQLG